jgi:hypothetical protein
MGERRSIIGEGEIVDASSLPTLVSGTSTTTKIPAPTFDASGDAKVRPETLIMEYSGDSDPARWLQEVTQIVSLGKWSEPLTIRLMLNKLRGAAKLFIENAVPVGEDLNFQKLGQLLSTRFGQRASLITRLLKLKTAEQESGETLLDFASRLRMLGYDAATNANEAKDMGPRLIAYFLHGLASQRIRDSVILQKPQTFEDAISMAMEAELEYARDTNYAGQRTDKLFDEEINTNTSKRNGSRGYRNQTICDYCQNQHRGICRQRLRDERRCYDCQSRDHFAGDMECSANRRNNGNVNYITGMTHDAEEESPLFIRF